MAVAFCRVHVVAHAPQLLVVLSGVSQPFAASLSQLPHPIAQEMAHTPAAQLAVPFVVAQALPHAPQLVTEVVVSVSHPLSVLPSQLPQPALHAATAHVPPEHVPSAFGGAHVAPHPPQFDREVSAVSQPFAASLSQLPQPTAHVTTAHVPPAQSPVACAGLHPTPQPPQLEELSRRVSHPVATVPSQSPQLFEQAMLHLPAVHVAAPLVVEHALPHAPQ